MWTAKTSDGLRHTGIAGTVVEAAGQIEKLRNTL